LSGVEQTKRNYAYFWMSLLPANRDIPEGKNMPLDFIIGAAVGAGLASEKVRKTLRKGVVYGLAGVLTAYDKVSDLATNIRSHKSETKETPPSSASQQKPSGPASSAQPATPTESAGTH
jgi:hypothetical protein